MSLKEKSRFLGVGCCGGKEAKEFYLLGYKCDAANGSTQDLRALGDMPKYQLQNFDGFGGHREIAIDCFSENTDFLDYIQNIEEEIVFVLFGGGGSTGSGCATIICEMLLENRDEEGRPEKIVCPVISLPSADEAPAKHRNAYQAVQEMQELDGLGAAFFINNDIGKDYNYMNRTFAKLLNEFLTNDSYSQINNFDESERLEMLRNGGAFVLSLFNEKNPEVMLDRLTKDGIFAPIESNKVCENIGIIHAGNNNKDIEKSMVVSVVGKPKNIFEGYNNGKGTLIAVSGLDYPVTHVSKLGELTQMAYEERNRNKKQSVQKLPNLSFVENDAAKKVSEPVQKKKTPSKLDMLRKRMGK